MAKHRLTRGIKYDLLLIFYQEPMPNEERHKAVCGAYLKKNQSLQLPCQVAEELITMLVHWVSSYSQNIGRQWPRNMFFYLSREQLESEDNPGDGIAAQMYVVVYQQEVIQD